MARVGFGTSVESGIAAEGPLQYCSNDYFSIMLYYLTSRSRPRGIRSYPATALEDS